MRVLVTGGSGSSGATSWRVSPRRTTCSRPRTPSSSSPTPTAVRAWLRAHPVDAVVHAAVKPGHRNAPDPTGAASSEPAAVLRLLRVPGRSSAASWWSARAPCTACSGRCSSVREDELGQVVPADEHGFSKYVEASWLARRRRRRGVASLRRVRSRRGLRHPLHLQRLLQGAVRPAGHAAPGPALQLRAGSRTSPRSSSARFGLEPARALAAGRVQRDARARR